MPAAKRKTLGDQADAIEEAESESGPPKRSDYATGLAGQLAFNKAKQAYESKQSKGGGGAGYRGSFTPKASTETKTTKAVDLSNPGYTRKQETEVSKTATADEKKTKAR